MLLLRITPIQIANIKNVTHWRFLLNSNHQMSQLVVTKGTNGSTLVNPNLNPYIIIYNWESAGSLVKLPDWRWFKSLPRPAGTLGQIPQPCWEFLAKLWPHVVEHCWSWSFIYFRAPQSQNFCFYATSYLIFTSKKWGSFGKVCIFYARFFLKKRSNS